MDSPPAPPPNGGTRLSLLLGVRQREPAARECLCRLYAPLVRGHCLRVGFPPGETEDAVQEVFTVVLEKVDDFERQRAGSFWSWLREIARLAWLGRQRQGPRGVGGTQHLEAVAGRTVREESDPLDVREILQRAIEELRGRTRLKATSLDAYLLFAVERLPAEAVAERLGMQPEAVHTAVCRVRAQLQKCFGPLLDLDA
jgi:RNA polymerase sigma factor (sigma-70 family)